MTTIRTLESFSPRNQIYVEMLRDADPEARANALAELAGRLDDELAGELGALLASSRDLDFRLQLCEDLAITLAAGACFAAGLEDEEEDEEEGAQDGEDGFLGRAALAALEENLAALYRDEAEDPRLRRKALEVAVLSPRPWQEEAVRECWARPEPAWRSTALCCMGHLYPVDFADEIAEGLESPIAALRAAAIAAADDRELRELGPRILEIAADRSGDLEVLLCAIEALPNLRPPGARKLLLRLRGEPAPVGHFAADALEHLDENCRAEQLIAELRGAGPPAVKLTLLMRFPGEAASYLQPPRRPEPPAAR